MKTEEEIRAQLELLKANANLKGTFNHLLRGRLVGTIETLEWVLEVDNDSNR